MPHAAAANLQLAYLLDVKNGSGRKDGFRPFGLCRIALVRNGCATTQLKPSYGQHLAARRLFNMAARASPLPDRTRR